jgi:YD repeat-containing protein
MSCEQDLWGYYNANQAKTLFPKLYIYPNLIGNDRFRVYPKSNYNGTNSFYLDQGANRLPNDAVIQYNVLNEIDYPTGGYIKYTYEPNDFYFEGEKLTGCGIRVSKTELSDGINSAKNIITNYSYKEASDVTKSSGRLFNMPVFAALTNSIYWDDAKDKYMDLSDINFNYSSIDYYKKFLYLSSNDMSILGSFIGDNFGYNNVTVDVGGKGKSVYTYSVPGIYGQDNDCYDPSDPSCSCIPSESCYCDGLFHSFKMNYIHKKTTCTAYLDNLDLTLNFVPFIYDWNRGLLLNKKDYNNNNLVKETNNFYKVFFRNGNSAEIIYGIHKDQLVPYLYNDVNGGPCMNENLFAFSKYYFLTQVAKVLQSSKETIYDSNNNNKSISTTTTYDYNSFGQVSCISQTQSDGSVIKTVYRYLNDVFSYAGQPYNEVYQAFAVMNAKNMISDPIETITYRDNKVIASEVKSFKEFPLYSGKVFPSIRFGFESKNPIVSTSYVLSTVNNPHAPILMDSNLKPKIFFDNYDNYGNLLQFHKVNDINTSNVWGYNRTLPIADVKNANLSEIFFTSYEEDGDFSGLAYKCTTDRHSGSQCDFVPAGGFNKAIDFPKSVLHGKYVYSAWVKTSGSGTYVSIKDFTNGTTSAYSWTSVPNTYGQWKYFETVANLDDVSYNSSNNIRVEVWNSGSTSAYVDDVRFRPFNSQMTTYTYTPLVGITSVTDNLNRTTFYEYDSFGRLTVVKDESGYILNYYQYRYSTDPDPLVGCTLSQSNYWSCSYYFTISGPNFDPTNYTYEWDFGDGSVLNSSSNFMDYTYFISGRHWGTVKIKQNNVVVKTLLFEVLNYGCEEG